MTDVSGFNWLAAATYETAAYAGTETLGPVEDRPANDRDYYAIGTPHMPLPGPDFIAEAESTAVEKKKYKARRLPDGGYEVEVPDGLDYLYFSALYENNHPLSLRFKGRVEVVQLIPGHLWGGATGGPRPADVMIVGKWPGADEVNFGRNMCGPTGSLTIETLEKFGCQKETYDRFYVTNFIKHPNVDPSSQRAPAAWKKNMQPLLENELRIVRPKYLICFGAEATEGVLGDLGTVSSLQGRVVEKKVLISRPGEPEEWHTIKVMTSIHPAFALHSQDKIPELERSIAQFIELITGRVASTPVENYGLHVIYQERHLKQVVDRILAEHSDGVPFPVAIDCEWQGEHSAENNGWLRTIQFAVDDKEGYCVAFRQCGGLHSFSPSVASAVPHLRRLFLGDRQAKPRIIGHNFRADLPWIRRKLDQQLGEDMCEAFQAPLTFEETKTTGGFDTMLAAHAVRETEASYSLDILAQNYCGMLRYDHDLEKWKKQFCYENDIEPSELEGYGMCPDWILHPYAIKDVIATIKLFNRYNNVLLDRDLYGNRSRITFWREMRATLGVLEMEDFGVFINRRRAEALTKVYMGAKRDLLADLQQRLKWETFNHQSPPQCVAMLFGPQYVKQTDKKTGLAKNILPTGSKTLNLRPIKSSGKPGKPWEKLVYKRQDHLHSPSTDKEVLGGLITRLKGDEKTGKPDLPGYDEVLTLRNLRFTSQVIKSILRPPRTDKEGQVELDEDGNLKFDKGIVSSIRDDDRVHASISQTKETGRFSCARPNLQAISKRREAAYEKILKKDYLYPLRTIIEASPGYTLVEADYMGAELFMMAVQSGDETMIDHVLRSNLPDGDPRKYDIHSTIAVKAFDLKCDPSKEGLKSIGRAYLRDVSKTIVFGIPYGRGDEAVVRAVEEEGVQISMNDAAAIREAVLATYPRLEPYLADCQGRVTSPGWLSNCYGRYRRFIKSRHAPDTGSLEREAGNFPIQSGVADAVNIAIDHLYNYPGRRDANGYRFKMILQIHDAILFEVRYDSLDWFLGDEKEHRDGVLQECMTRRVPVWPCDLNGRPRDGATPLYMGAEYQVMFNWGEKPDRDQGLACGIPERFLPKPKVKAA